MRFPTSYKDRFLRVGPGINALIYAGGTMLSQFLNVLLLPVLTRHLSQAEIGIFAYTTALCLFLNLVGTLSLNTYVLRSYFDCRTAEARKSLFGTAFCFLAILNTCLLAGELIIAPKLLQATHSQVPFFPYVALALLTVPLDIVHQIPLAYFRVREKASAFVLITTGQAFMNVALTLYFVLVRHTGVVGRYYAALAAGAVVLLFDLLLIGRVCAFTLKLGQIRSALRFSLPLVPYNLSYYVPILTDRLVLERYVPLGEIGIYSVGSAIATGMNALISGVYRAIEPTVYRAAGSATLNDTVARLRRRMLYGFAVAGLFLSGLARELVTLIAGAKFVRSGEIVGLIAVSVVLRGATMPMDLYLVALKRTNLLLYGYAIGALASVLLNIFLIRLFGIVGAGLAGIGAALVTLFALGVFCNRVAGLPWTFPEDALVVCCMYAGGRAISSVVAGAFWVTIAAKTAVSAAICIPVLWLLLRGGANRIPRPAAPVGALANDDVPETETLLPG